jgi:hypothetical protein
MNIDGNMWELFLGENKVFKEVQKQIIDEINAGTMKKYWNKNRKANLEQFENVYWEAMEKAMRTSTTHVRNWIVKRAANECGANAVLFRRNQKDSDRCRLCNEIETPTHVYKCKHEMATTTWMSSMQEFSKDLIRRSTDPSIVTQLCAGFNKWRDKSMNETEEMINSQTAIGWNGIMEGCIGFH